jgi:hypothetical protein
MALNKRMTTLAATAALAVAGGKADAGPAAQDGDAALQNVDLLLSHNGHESNSTPVSSTGAPQTEPSPPSLTLGIQYGEDCASIRLPGCVRKSAFANLDMGDLTLAAHIEMETIRSTLLPLPVLPVSSLLGTLYGGAGGWGRLIIAEVGPKWRHTGLDGNASTQISLEVGGAVADGRIFGGIGYDSYLPITVAGLELPAGKGVTRDISREKRGPQADFTVVHAFNIPFAPPTEHVNMGLVFNSYVHAGVLQSGFGLNLELIASTGRPMPADPHTHLAEATRPSGRYVLRGGVGSEERLFDWIDRTAHKKAESLAADFNKNVYPYIPNLGLTDQQLLDMAQYRSASGFQAAWYARLDGPIWRDSVSYSVGCTGQLTGSQRRNECSMAMSVRLDSPPRPR